MTVEATAQRTFTSHEICLDAPICEDASDPLEPSACFAVDAADDRARSPGLTAAIDGFMAASISFGAELITDAKALAGFSGAAETTVAHLLLEVELGNLTSEEAATELHRLKGTLELQLEASSGDLRRAWLELRGSRTGETFYAARKRVAEELFGRSSALGPDELRAVHARLAVELAEDGAAAARLGVTLTRAGYGFIGISAAIAIHNVATAEDTGRALMREAVVFGAGRIGAGLGAAAGGALCGPGAPVCAPVGALVGDVLFSMGAGALFDAAFTE